MNQVSNTRTSLFLMEIIISVLFLSLCGAICVQMFVRAHLTGKESVDVNHAVIWTQNMAESFRGVSGDIEQLEELYSPNCVLVLADEESESEGTDGIIILFMDKDWQLIEYPASDISGLTASYEVITSISQVPAYELYGDEADTADTERLRRLDIMAATADIIVVDVDGRGIISTMSDALTDDHVISHIRVDCLQQ